MPQSQRRRGRPDPSGFVLDTSDAIMDAQSDIRSGCLLMAQGYRKLVQAQRLLFEVQGLPREAA